MDDENFYYEDVPEQPTHVQKIAHAIHEIDKVNPDFLDNMTVLRHHLGQDWKRAESDGSYDAWDNILLMYYALMNQD
jgi:hypothetical protein